MTQSIRFARAAAALTAMSLFFACHGHDDGEARPPDGSPDIPIAGQVASRDSAEAAADAHEAAMEAAAESAEAAPDVIAIVNTERSIVLGLRDDTVYMRLSDSVLTKAGKELKSKTKGSGVGGWIEQTVKSTVHDALRMRVAYDLDDIDDVRYVNGAIRFEYNDRHALSFEDFKADEKPVLESFTPEDAKRFVAAVREAKRGK